MVRSSSNIENYSSLMNRLVCSPNFLSLSCHLNGESKKDIIRVKLPTVLQVLSLTDICSIASSSNLGWSFHTPIILFFGRILSKLLQNGGRSLVLRRDCLWVIDVHSRKPKFKTAKWHHKQLRPESLALQLEYWSLHFTYGENYTLHVKGSV